MVVVLAPRSSCTPGVGAELSLGILICTMSPRTAAPLIVMAFATCPMSPISSQARRPNPTACWPNKSGKEGNFCVRTLKKKKIITAKSVFCLERKKNVHQLLSWHSTLRLARPVAKWSLMALLVDTELSYIQCSPLRPGLDGNFDHHWAGSFSQPHQLCSFCVSCLYSVVGIFLLEHFSQ